MQGNFTTITKAAIADALYVALDVAEAAAADAGDARWITALGTAADWLHQADSFQWDSEHSALFVPSATRAGRGYTANGVCQCEAYTKGDAPAACWHRAAARVIRNALRLQHHADANAQTAQRLTAYLAAPGPVEQAPARRSTVVAPRSAAANAAHAALLECF
jgi:hypothetical protein